MINDTLFQNSLDAIAIIKDDKHIAVNPAYVKLFGFDNAEELIGTSIHDRISELKDERDFTAIGYKHNGEKFYAQVRMIHADDQIILIISEDVLIKHILEKKQEYDKNRQLLEHEFHTHLKIISMCNKLLEKYHVKLAPERIQNYHQKIETAIEKLSELIFDVINPERIGWIIDGPPPTPEMKKIHLDTLCRDMLDEFSANLTTHTFDFMCNVDNLSIKADSRWLNRAFINLLSNAVTYSPDGSTVTITVDKNETHAIITISDENTGELPDLNPHVNDPIVKSTLASYSGRLSFAIAKEIVENHNGYIEVESTIGKGSTFKVFLPL